MSLQEGIPVLTCMLGVTQAQSRRCGGAWRDKKNAELAGWSCLPQRAASIVEHLL
jgi:hypothetical protein